MHKTRFLIELKARQRGDSYYLYQRRRWWGQDFIGIFDTLEDAEAAIDRLKEFPKWYDKFGKRV